MASIKLVRNDTGPQIKLILTDSVTGAATDLTGATVTLHLRAVNTTVVLLTRQATILPPATSGVAVVVWLVGDLNLPEGEYEGEIEVVLGSGVRETLFTPLQFVIREEFA